MNLYLKANLLAGAAVMPWKTFPRWRHICKKNSMTKLRDRPFVLGIGRQLLMSQKDLKIRPRTKITVLYRPTNSFVDMDWGRSTEYTGFLNTIAYNNTCVVGKKNERHRTPSKHICLRLVHSRSPCRRGVYCVALFLRDRSLASRIAQVSWYDLHAS